MSKTVMYLLYKDGEPYVRSTQYSCLQRGKLHLEAKGHKAEIRQIENDLGNTHEGVKNECM